MRNNEFIQPKKSYFAAANGYTGFRSYFDTVFNPRAYTHIYVLKGGPGTGKSTLMKRLCTHFQNIDYDVEAVFCSSDPSSLDGVIICKGDKKIAVIDGTAPHEADAKIPGAVDEIINLGDMWSSDALTRHREEILSLNDKKHEHYKSAYEFLCLAGAISRYEEKIVRSAYQHEDQKQINDIFYDIQNIKYSRNEDIKLISCFGKYGYRTFDIKNFSGRSNISVSGISGSEFIFMERVRREAERRGTEYTRFPSPYSDSISEGIYLKESDTFISVYSGFDTVIDTSNFLDGNAIKRQKDNLSFLFDKRNEVLAMSRNEFEKASDRHFDLEAIYSPTMDFKRIDSVCERLIEKIAGYIER